MNALHSQMKGLCRADKAIAESEHAFKGECTVAYPPYPSADQKPFTVTLN
jgi:hypothetical protein